MRPMSLRARLLAGMALVAVVLAVVATAITVTTREQLIGQVDDRLAQSARDQPPSDDSADSWSDATPPEPPPDAPSGEDDDDHGHGYKRERLSDLYEGVIIEGDELVTLLSPNIGGDGVDADRIPWRRLPDDVGEVRYFDVPGDEGGTYRVRAVRLSETVVSITGLPLDDVNETITRLVVLQGGALLVVLGVLGAVTFWVVRLGIRPVKDMTSAASQIAAGDLGVRLPQAAEGTEAGALATALNRMLGRIETAVDERAQSEERLRRFVADASHELRTPVTTIRGYAELYRFGGLDDKDALDDAMQRTEAEALRMGRLVEDMLALAKLDEERPLAAEPVDLAEIAGEAVADARVVAPERQLELDAEAAVVVGDPDRLRQVVANVVGNALVHTDDATITVRTRLLPGGGPDPLAVLEVIDDGSGMEPEVAARITERFYRADASRSRRRGGSGLGLAIVDAVIRSHGGRVEVESAVGEGTTVRLFVPIDTPDESSPGSQPTPRNDP